MSTSKWKRHTNCQLGVVFIILEFRFTIHAWSYTKSTKFVGVFFKEYIAGLNLFLWCFEKSTNPHPRNTHLQIVGVLGKVIFEIYYLRRFLFSNSRYARRYIKGTQFFCVFLKDCFFCVRMRWKFHIPEYGRKKSALYGNIW